MKQPGEQEAQRDIFNIDNKGTVTVVNHPTPQRSRSESLLLQAVKQEVISRLDQSLHNAVFINLGKRPQPQQVKRPWDAEIKIGSKSPEPMPAEMSILEVFDRPDIAGRLLILGEPGAGKTTTMLDLAKGLCDRAEQDATAFIPVLLNLSSWKDPKQRMTVWLVEELKSKYGVRKDIGTQWLAEKQLLPLLDGLDEVKPEHQESCVQAINRWLESEDRPPSLAVCCRREEYEKVVRGQWQATAEESQDETRVHLNGAILLQTLTDEQVQVYLTAANQPELWQMLRQDEELWSLIKTPLWLSITLLSYEGLPLSRWQQTTSTEQRMSLLLDAYVEGMLRRTLNNRIHRKCKPSNSRQTQQWLTYLAQQLQRESLTEFLIESINHNWLSNLYYLYLYRSTLMLSFGIVLWEIILLNDGSYKEFSSSLSSALILFLIWYFWFRAIPMRFFEAICFFFFKFFKSVPTRKTQVLIISLLFSGSLILYLSLLPHYIGIGNLIFGVSFFYHWIFDAVGGKAPTFESVNFKSIIFNTKVFSQSLVCGLFLSLILGLVYSTVIGFSILIYWLIFGFTLGILFGLFLLIRKSISVTITPNQGIRESVKFFVLITIFSSFILLVVIYLSSNSALGGISPTVSQQKSVLAYGMWIGFLLAGRASIQHLLLRLILFGSGASPWNYARFLDYCTERRLLQRVGGRYRFIHKSLQEHFAAMRE